MNHQIWLTEARQVATSALMTMKSKSKGPMVLSILATLPTILLLTRRTLMKHLLFSLKEALGVSKVSEPMNLQLRKLAHAT